MTMMTPSLVVMTLSATQNNNQQTKGANKRADGVEAMAMAKAMLTATAMATVMANGNGKGNCNDDGNSNANGNTTIIKQRGQTRGEMVMRQWQQQWQW